MDKKALLAKYEANLAISDSKAQYLKYALDFLTYADVLDKEHVVKYLSKMRRSNKAPGTIRLAFGIIRRLFNVNDLEWPFRRGEGPVVTEQDENRPALGFDIVERMVQTARHGEMDETARTFLALSTIYGVRREELQVITPPDVDLANSVIFIKTVHGGRQRYHLIPEEIKPYLETHDFSQHYSVTRVSQIFWVVVNACGLEQLKTERLGWHSLRRPMLKALIKNGMDPFAANDFMRWKSGARELAMPMRYYSNVEIGLDGKKRVSEEAEGDRDVFEHFHPYLKLWR